VDRPRFELHGLYSGKPMTPGRVGRIVSHIGEKARVAVSPFTPR
jgi:hypothetical protein